MRKITKERARGKGIRSTFSAEAVSDTDAIAITRVAISKAHAGDPNALRLMLDRLWPVPKGRLVTMDLPAVDDAAGIMAAHGALIHAVANGKLTVEEASALSQLLSSQLKLVEATELERRLRRVEEAVLNTTPATPTEWDAE